MATSEIDKLERRYAENPYGLTFAPLAEMYRKNGDVARALELLGAGIDRHPEYIPARIVLGRCHLDRGEVAEAEDAFTRVLALDGENVIALKALADISERLGRYDDAERQLQALLAVDRNNETAREQLARLGAVRQGDADRAPPTETVEATIEVSMVAEAAPVAESVPEVVPEPMSAVPEQVVPEPAVPEPKTAELMVTEPAMPEVVVSEAAPPVASEPPVVLLETTAPTDSPAVPLILDELVTADEPVARLEGVELAEEVTLSGSTEAVAGLVRPDLGALRDELLDDGDEFHIETADDLILRPSDASEFQMPDASQELVAAKPDPDPLAGIEDVGPAEPVPTEASVACATSPSPEAVTTPEAVVAAEDTAGGDAPTIEDASTAPTEETPSLAPALSETETSETPCTASRAAPAPESVAEPAAEPPVKADVEPEPGLILTETMAEVLIQQGYTADALRIYRELERRSADDQRLREKRAELEAQIPNGAKGTPSYAARATGGQSAGALFRNLLTARLGAAPSGAMRIPTSPPPATASGTAGAPTRPAADSLSLSAVFGEATSPVPPTVPTGSKQEVSFDEFFGAPAADRAARGARTPTPQEDDLDQFHAWLQNLKR